MFYSLTQETVHTFFRQVMLILELHLQMVNVDFEPEEKTERRFYDSFGAQGLRLESQVLN